MRKPRRLTLFHLADRLLTACDGYLQFRTEYDTLAPEVTRLRDACREYCEAVQDNTQEPRRPRSNARSARALSEIESEEAKLRGLEEEPSE